MAADLGGGRVLEAMGSMGHVDVQWELDAQKTFQNQKQLTSFIGSESRSRMGHVN